MQSSAGLRSSGEAANNLSDTFKAGHPEIPWALIKGMRNRLVHEYNEIDLELVWTTLHADIPQFQKLLKTYIDQ
jgi:uncharacterized protein with HEPN domain